MSFTPRTTVYETCINCGQPVAKGLPCHCGGGKFSITETLIPTNTLRWYNGVLQQSFYTTVGTLTWCDVPQITEPTEALDMTRPGDTIHET